MVQAVNLSGMIRIKPRTREQVSKTKFLHISIISVVLYLWPILVNQNSNGSQFFINQSTTDYSSKLPTSSYPKKIIEAYKEGGNPTLDGKHPVFGQVIDGMDVVDKIAKAEKDEKDKPTTAITIDSIEIVKDYDFSKQ